MGIVEIYYRYGTHGDGNSYGYNTPSIRPHHPYSYVLLVWSPDVPPPSLNISASLNSRSLRLFSISHLGPSRPNSPVQPRTRTSHIIPEEKTNIAAQPPPH